MIKLFSDKYLKYLTCISVALMLASLVALAMLGFYTHPLGDDYYYGVHAAAALRNGEGILGVLSAAFKGTARQYDIWQGTYAAMFLMHIPPQVFGELCYKLYPSFVLLLFTTGVFYLTFAFIPAGDKEARLSAITIASLTVFLCVNFVPLCGETFYWYNGSVYYTGFLSLTFFFFGILFRFLKDKKLSKIILMSVLGLIIAGGNYTSLLPAMLIILSIIIFKALSKYRKAVVGVSVAFFFTLSGFIFSVLAPGNAVRQATSYGTDPVKAILKSLLQCFNYLVHWSGICVFLVLLFLTPLFVKIIQRTEYDFKYPLIACPVAFGIFASSECPTFYAQNNGGAARVFDICFYMMVICILFMYFYLLGWFVKRRDKGQFTFKAAEFLPGIMLVVILALISAFRPISETIPPINSIKAATSLVKGEAAAYDRQFRERMEAIKNNPNGDLVFNPYTVPDRLKWVLWLGDLSTDPTANEDFASFYGLNSVRLSDAQ